MRFQRHFSHYPHFPKFVNKKKAPRGFNQGLLQYATSLFCQPIYIDHIPDNKSRVFWPPPCLPSPHKRSYGLRDGPELSIG